MTDSQTDLGAEEAKPEYFDVIVVGAGIAGMYALYRFRELGLSVRVFEQGSGVGGTWFWNRYPGARCDVESWDYSYSFSKELEQEWNWTERYPVQAELERYLNHVADRFDLRRDIRFDTRVDQAHFDEDANRWNVRTSDGASYSAHFCVMASGCLSKVNLPNFEGLDTFEGEWYHTARWPKEDVDFTGKRVGVIGTGSTGVQAIPQIAEQADHLFVFQRTAHFAVPAHNGPLDPAAARKIKRSYPERRELARTSSNGLARHPLDRSALEVDEETRRAAFEESWQRGGAGFATTFNDIITSSEANEFAAEFAREKIRARIADPEVAEKLLARDYPFGTRRLIVDIDYFETYNRDNVTLVDVKSSPIEEITPRGIRTGDGEYQLDIIVFAIGFDGITGALLDIDIQGKEQLSLREKWADGPQTYLGLAIAGFPNLLLITGPGSPAVLSNVIVSIEQHVDWVADCISHLREHGLDRIEADPAAEEAWTQHVNDLAGKTLLHEADSWWIGANIPGKPRVFMPYIGGVGNYRRRCDEVTAKGYTGFVLSAAGPAEHGPSTETRADGDSPPLSSSDSHRSGA